ncbi:MAG TPA: gas vesicle protein GvpG [Vicinamibacterales bacterium]|jgi:hypothetical protein|nr:gas vesicle protein GvpG [Vicinamibacterales bacterium]
MFLLDSLMISGIRWAIDKVVTAAEAELNDDSALRDRLLEAEMQREMGEISDDEFRAIEVDVLQAIREIKERRDGGAGAFAFGGGQPIEAGEDSRFQVEAELAGDFYGAPETPPQTGTIEAAGRGSHDRARAGSRGSPGAGPRTRTDRTRRTAGNARSSRTRRPHK